MNTKQLWAISKFSLYETFLDSQMNSLGANQADFMEKMEKNQKHIRKQNKSSSFMVILFLFTMTVLPVAGLDNTLDAFKAGISQNWIWLVGPTLIGLFFLVQTAYLNLYGSYYSSALISGSSTRWLATLPVNHQDLRKIIYFTYIRKMITEFIVCFIGLPIASIFMTKSLWAVLFSIGISFVNMVLTFSVTILAGAFLLKVNKVNEGNTKRSKSIRTITNIGFGLISIVIVVLFQVAMNSISTVFMTPILSDAAHAILNEILPIVAFPFSPAYLLIGLSFPEYIISQSLMLKSALGVLLYILLTIGLTKKALAVLDNVIYEDKISKAKKNAKNISQSAKDKQKNREEILGTLQLVQVSAKKAYFKKDLLSITRDVGIIFFFLMPIIYPLILLINLRSTVGSEGESLLISYTMTNLIYSGLGAIFVMNGLTKIESTGGSIAASLPMRERERFLTKLKFIYIILPLSLLIPLLFFTGNEYFRSFILITLIAMMWIIDFGIFAMLLNVRLFGKLKHKYVIEPVNIERKKLKNAAIIGSVLMINIALIIGLALLSNIYNYEVATLILIPLGIIFMVGLFIWMNKLFPKPSR